MNNVEVYIDGEKTVADFIDWAFDYNAVLNLKQRRRLKQRNCAWWLLSTR